MTSLSIYSQARACLLTGLSLAVLAGCETNKKPLVGERIPISVLTARTGLTAQNVQGAPIHLSEPRPRDTWGQPDAEASHDKGHIAFQPQGDHLMVAWSRSVSSADKNARLLATPAVTQDGIFMLDHHGRVLKVDPKTGDVLFRVNVMPDGKEGEPVLGGGCSVAVTTAGITVYVATPYGELLALNGEAGDILWRTALQSPARGAPCVADGEIYVSTLQNQLQVFNAEGQVLWAHAGMPELLGVLGLASPGVAEDIVIITYTSGEVFALRRQTGTVIWSDMISGPRHLGEAQNVAHVRANPLIHEGVVYAISYSGQMVAFNLHNGRRLWEAPVGSIHTPVCDGKTLFMLTSDQEIAALDGQTGQVIWAHPLSQFQLNTKKTGDDVLTWAGPLLAGGGLYLLSDRGDLLTLDPKTGLSLAQPPLALQDTFSLPLVATQGGLFGLSESGRLYALR